MACQTQRQRTSHLFTANQLAKDGLYREALTSYEQVLNKNPKQAEALKNSGGILIRLGNYKKGVRLLKKASKYYPRCFECHFFLGEGYRALENYSQAIFHYQSALRFNKEHNKTLKGLAWSYYKIRFYSAALKRIKQLRKLYPKDEHINIMYVRTLIKLKRISSAEKVLSSRLIRKSSSQIKPYLLSLRGDLFLARGKVSKAETYYRKALKLVPLMASPLLGLSKCLFERNQKDKAKTYLERALRIRPQMKEAYHLLARIYEKNHKNKALTLYKTFYKKIQTDPEYLKELPKIRKKIAFLKRKSF